jgi:cystathionine beta-lyase/cystathionine gamma-synthase
MKKTPSRKPHLSTLAVHAGQSPEPMTGAVMPPLFLTSTYALERFGRYRQGYEYARTQHPNRRQLEANVAALEGGKFAYAYASGMAAVDAVTNLLKAGDHVVVSQNVYGGVFRLFEHVLRGRGLDFSFVDTADLRNVERAAKPNTKMLYAETPTNPMMTLTDVRAASRLARKNRWLLVVDNTFMTPVWQKPLALGADIVVHSTTKFLNGHSDCVGGVAVTNSKKVSDRLYFVQKSAGAVLAPFDCWLTLRGIKTLTLRMEAHEKGARRLARFLARHPKVRRVFYPGLPSHPQHALAKRQMSGFGGVITFDLGNIRRVEKFLNAVRLCTLAESLGGVETLISHPATMTHASIPPAERKRIGIADGLVRISVGIENAEDVEHDIKSALGKL